MLAARVVDLSGPEGIEVADVEEPTPTADQLLVEVDAAGVNFPDLLMSQGKYQLRPELPFVPGSEVAGVVLSAPADSEFSAGDRIAAFTMLNGLAERTVVDSGMAVRIPDSLSFAEAAALPMNYLTMEFALIRRGQVQPGETVLIHGAAGGIGTAGIQIAKAVGARVIAVASSPEKQQAAIDAGADESIPVDEFLTAAKSLTDGNGVDVVVDPVGGDRFTDSLRALAPEGRLLVIGFTGGQIPEVKVNRLLLNNIDVRGVGWGAFAFFRPGYVAQQWRSLESLMATGAIKPLLGSQYSLTDVGSAIAELGERRAVGKVVVRVRD